jgi:hypothetical protein
VLARTSLILPGPKRRGRKRTAGPRSSHVHSHLRRTTAPRADRK